MGTVSVSQRSFEDEGKRILGMGDRWDKALFLKAFGGCPWVCYRLWKTIQPQYTISPSALPQHLLWTMMFVKIYIDEDVLAVLAKTQAEEFHDWVWLFLKVISEASEHLVSLVLVELPT